MLRREIGCSSRGTIRGTTMPGIVPKALCYHRGMARIIGVLLVVVLAATAASAADTRRDLLERARSLYNGGQFEGAIAAADQARLTPSRADSADLIAARAYLERFRTSRTADDLVSGRA